MDYLKIHIGKEVAKAREAAELTQDQMAEMTGLSQSSVANIENGRQLPPLDRLYMIASVVGCEISQLIPTKDQFIVALFIHYKK